MNKTELKKRRKRHKEEPRIRMRDNARKRAINKNLKFELYTFKDLPKVPKKCYFLGIPLKVCPRGGGDSSPSLDRIDNKKGHNKFNTVCACLKCNLERRTKNSKKFLFTKKMNLIKKL